MKTLSTIASTKRFFAFLFVVIVSSLTGACYNAFSGMSSTTTDPANYEDGIKALNALDYTTAISKFSLLSSDYLSRTDVKMSLAGAYAGKCGFNFISYFNTLSTSAGSTPLFKYFMNQWTTTTTSSHYCRLAEDVVKTISITYQTRDASQSLFLVLLGMAKIGIYLREFSDTDRDGSGDFSVTVPTDGYCLSTNISDSVIAEVGAGLGMVISNLTRVGTSLSSSAVDLTSINTACALLTPNPCNIENASEFSASAIKSIRTLLNVSGAPLSTGVVAGAPCP